MLIFIYVGVSNFLFLSAFSYLKYGLSFEAIDGIYLLNVVCRWEWNKILSVFHSLKCQTFVYIYFRDPLLLPAQKQVTFSALCRRVVCFPLEEGDSWGEEYAHRLLIMYIVL